MRFRDDWPELLAAYIEECMDKPFAWGSHDCIMMAANWIERASGHRVFSSTYADAEGAARKLKQEGGITEAISRVLGEPLLVTKRAQRGDIAVVDCKGRLCAGIVLTEFVAGPGAQGLVYVSRAQMHAAWRVQNA